MNFDSFTRKVNLRIVCMNQENGLRFDIFVLLEFFTLMFIIWLLKLQLSKNVKLMFKARENDCFEKHHV